MLDLHNLRFLKPKFIELNKVNKKISSIVVTHIDNDHISGVIKFIEENKFNELIEIENVLHNSFQHLKNLEDCLTFNGKSISDLIINYQLT